MALKFSTKSCLEMECGKKHDTSLFFFAFVWFPSVGKSFPFSIQSKVLTCSIYWNGNSLKATCFLVDFWISCFTPTISNVHQHFELRWLPPEKKKHSNCLPRKMMLVKTMPSFWNGLFFRGHSFILGWRGVIPAWSSFPTRSLHLDPRVLDTCGHYTLRPRRREAPQNY